jgi:hypothetical protein
MSDQIVVQGPGTDKAFLGCFSVFFICVTVAFVSTRWLDAAATAAAACPDPAAHIE